jgi:hypothetical protein
MTPPEHERQVLRPQRIRLCVETLGEIKNAVGGYADEATVANAVRIYCALLTAEASKS